MYILKSIKKKSESAAQRLGRVTPISFRSDASEWSDGAALTFL